MQKNNLYKVEFVILALEKDGSSKKEVFINTNDKFYAFFSEHFLNEVAYMFNSYQKFYKDFEVEGEWNAGKHLKVTTNREWFQVLMIENVDGYMRKVEFNGKELLKAGFDKTGRKIKQTVELPSGQKVDTMLTWETDNFYNNKAKMTFDGPAAQKVETEFKWDMAPAKKNFAVKAHGNTEMLGEFEVSRAYQYDYKNGAQSLESKGMTSLPNSPFPENLETEMQAKFNTFEDFMFNSYVILAGEKFGWEYDNNTGFKWSF
jgi:hypothetical protein